MVATTWESWKSKANENITFRKEKKKKKVQWQKQDRDWSPFGGPYITSFRSGRSPIPFPDPLLWEVGFILLWRRSGPVLPLLFQHMRSILSCSSENVERTKKFSPTSLNIKKRTATNKRDMSRQQKIYTCPEWI